MKKFYTLLVVMVLLFSISAATLAAVDFGGNIRVWYKSNFGDNNTGGFYFDRLALKATAIVAENDGFFSELRFAYKGALTTMAYDEFYYFHKNLFAEGDQLKVGYVFLPFINDKYLGIIQESLAKSYAGAKNSTGIKYDLKMDGFTGSLALTNWKNDTGTLASGDGSGFDMALRVSFKVIDELSVGVGYVNDATVTGGATTNTGSLVADVLYSAGPFGVFFEYVNKTPAVGSAQSGMYLEPNFKLMDNLTVYVGSTLASKDSGLTTSEWFVGGLKYQVASKTTLQAEFISYPDASAKNCFGIRLRQDF